MKKKLNGHFDIHLKKKKTNKKDRFEKFLYV